MAEKEIIKYGNYKCDGNSCGNSLCTVLDSGDRRSGVLVYFDCKSIKKVHPFQRCKGRKKVVAKSLGEALKENRIRCQMTQEFVAETLGVSRQSVSKWENGTSDPNTSNLIALAKLYGISPEELLKSIESSDINSQI